MPEDVVNPADPGFWDWLKKTPEFLAKFVDIVNEFAKLQGEDIPLPPAGPNDGPPARREVGDSVNITTAPITDAQLKALSDGFADQIVKDKAIEYVKGFITGLTMGG